MRISRVFDTPPLFIHKFLLLEVFIMFYELKCMNDKYNYLGVYNFKKKFEITPFTHKILATKIFEVFQIENQKNFFENKCWGLLVLPPPSLDP